MKPNEVADEENDLEKEAAIQRRWTGSQRSEILEVQGPWFWNKF